MNFLSLDRLTDDVIASYVDPRTDMIKQYRRQTEMEVIGLSIILALSSVLIARSVTTNV
jgi:hypothetical protein